MTGALGGVALLAGLVGVPLLLLWLGHGLRRRGTVGRGTFWGGVVGYAVGVLAWTVVAVGPATGWAAGGIRHAGVVTLLLAAGVVGMAAGAVAGHRGSGSG